MMDRRTFVKLLAGSAAALSLPRRARAAQTASRIIFFYFPDGIPGRSADGMPSQWHATGGETSFSLPDVLSPLQPFKDACVFFNGLSMGQADVGSHPGGAKKLLTASDGGGGESLDQHLARTVGASAPFRHVYLGAMANHNNATGDKHISYVGPGLTTPPEDNPLQAFSRLFAGSTPVGGGGDMTDGRQASVLDAVLADLNDLRSGLGGAEQRKLDQHLDALREVEKRVKGLGPGTGATCEMPASPQGVDSGKLYDAAAFPTILKAQIDLLVQAMACGLTKVGVIQASHHTSELLMSRFPGTPMYDPSFDMRSHQASHYGARHDPGKKEFREYVAQRKWFVGQFAYLLDQLKQRPDGAGTMLDTSLVLLCSEVSDGNTHSHDDMPFVLAGRGGGAIRTGRLHDAGGRRHAELLTALARAMGENISSFGQGGSGPLPGLLA